MESSLGLDRGDLKDLDGWAAVRLWKLYEQSDNPRALETLLAYNVADVLSLEVLAEYAVQRHSRGDGENRAPAPVKTHLNPFAPDRRILRQVLGFRTNV